MACPYFIPKEPVRDDAGIGRPNPPLGEFYSGSCAASGTELGNAPPIESCNFGYARGLPCFPTESPVDAVRFSIEEANEELVQIRWCEERDHRPVRHGISGRETLSEGAETPVSGDPSEAQLNAYAASYQRARARARHG